MQYISVVQVLVFFAVLVAMVKPVGWWLHAAVYERRPMALDRVLGPIERLIYRLAGVNPATSMRWQHYALALLAFNCVGLLALFLQLCFQGALPTGNGYPGMTPDLALNTAVSFVTNTNWQSYAGETAVSPLSQMLGLALQQFLSASTGVCVAIALIRGLARSADKGLGNFWVDLTRSWLYVLLPGSIVLAIFYVASGCVQTLGQILHVTTLEGAVQTIVTGPVASLEAIKNLGTNGGGYFNAGSAHPFEGPTPLSAYVQMLSVLAIPAGLTWTLGKAVRNTRQGWAIFWAMVLMLGACVGAVTYFEQSGTPVLTQAGVDVQASPLQAGGNMEGKEVRFGVVESALYAVVTTAASNGSVIAMHDSFTPLGGGLLLLNILVGEVIFGGVGVGLAGMVMYALLAVFIAGLMVGRTPEYIGKKIEAREVRMAMLAVLASPVAILIFAAIAAASPAGQSAVLNSGPHGFTEILYAYASAAGNNGSAFAGLSAGGAFYTLTLAAAMLIGRFGFILPVLCVAGSLAAKREVPASAGTLPTTGGLFVGLLVSVVIILGALTFFPALSLGPIAEYLL